MTPPRVALCARAQGSSGAIRRINRFREADRLFSQSSSFQPLLDLKGKEQVVPTVNEFKLRQAREGRRTGTPRTCTCMRVAISALHTTSKNIGIALRI